MAETWRVFESEREANVFGLMILPESGRPEWLISFRMNGEMTVEKQREIANKVAAAPDMLAVLKRVEADLVHLGAKGEPLKSIRAAIAKAEGRG